jgi:hypothetical protein
VRVIGRDSRRSSVNWGSSEMQMQYRRLGRSNLRVSAVGFGTTQLCRVPEQQALDTLTRCEIRRPRSALELAIQLHYSMLGSMSMSQRNQMSRIVPTQNAY